MLEIISFKEVERWDSIVRSFKEYDIYYISDYLKAYQINGDGEPTLFYFEYGDFRAINVVIIRNIRDEPIFSGRLLEGPYYDMTTPYGYGGFLMEGQKTKDNLRRLNDDYNSFCKSKGIISEFVRFHPLLKNHNALDEVYEIQILGETVSINLDSPEYIWDNMKSTSRNRARKAKKLGVKIFWGRNVEQFQTFIRLYNSTMDKHNANNKYYFSSGFYKSILEDLRYNSIMFYAEFQGKIIAMDLIIFANKQMHYHLAASDEQYQELAPQNLLIYEAACWGSANGYKILHLGGGFGGGEDSLFRFKRTFNKNTTNRFVIGRKVFKEEEYAKLVSIRETKGEISKDCTYFPKYRC